MRWKEFHIQGLASLLCAIVLWMTATWWFGLMDRTASEAFTALYWASAAWILRSRVCQNTNQQ